MKGRPSSSSLRLELLDEVAALIGVLAERLDMTPPIEPRR